MRVNGLSSVLRSGVWVRLFKFFKGFCFIVLFIELKKNFNYYIWIIFEEYYLSILFVKEIVVKIYLYDKVYYVILI